MAFAPRFGPRKSSLEVGSAAERDLLSPPHGKQVRMKLKDSSCLKYPRTSPPPSGMNWGCTVHLFLLYASCNAVCET